jgi:hypothetical protein
VSAGCSGELLGALQMIHDLRQGLARELPEFGIGAVLDLLFEQRRISLLILQGGHAHQEVSWMQLLIYSTCFRADNASPS